MSDEITPATPNPFPPRLNQLREPRHPPRNPSLNLFGISRRARRRTSLDRGQFRICHRPAEDRTWTASPPPKTRDLADSFADALSAFERTHSHRAETKQLQGTVVSLSADQVFLDIGYKTEGVLPRSAFPNECRGRQARRRVPRLRHRPQRGGLLRALALPRRAAPRLVGSRARLRRKDRRRRNRHRCDQGRPQRRRRRPRLHARQPQRHPRRRRARSPRRHRDHLPHHQARRHR